MVQAPSTAKSNLMNRAILMSSNRKKHCVYGYNSKIYIFMLWMGLGRVLSIFCFWRKKSLKNYELTFNFKLDIFFNISSFKYLLLDIFFYISSFRYLLSDKFFQISSFRYLLSDIFFQISSLRYLFSDIKDYFTISSIEKNLESSKIKTSKFWQFYQISPSSIFFPFVKFTKPLWNLSRFRCAYSPRFEGTSPLSRGQPSFGLPNFCPPPPSTPHMVRGREDISLFWFPTLNTHTQPSLYIYKG